MSRKLKILISGLEAEPLNISRLPLAINYQLDEFTSLGKTRGSSVKTFKLAYSKQNHGIFKSFYLPGVENDSVRDLLDCIIDVNSSNILKGKAKLVQAQTTGKASSYDVAIIGDNSDWFTDAKETILSDLPFNGGGLWHTWLGFWTAHSWTADRDYVYFIYNLGKWDDAPGFGVQVHEWLPAVKFKAILREFFDGLGYTIVSDFYNTPFFNRLYHYFSRDEMLNDRNWAANEGAYKLKTNSQALTPGFPALNYINVTFQDETTPPYNDPGGNMGSVDYTAPVKGYYTFEADVKYSGGTPPFNVAFAGFRKNGIGFIDLNNGNTAWGFYPPGGTLTSATVLLDAGDTIALRVAGITGGSVDSGTTIKATLTQKAVYGAGHVMNPREWLPADKTVADFIRGITHCFNLVWKTDSARKTVMFEPRFDYTLSGVKSPGFFHSPYNTFVDEPLDWTGLVDLNKRNRTKIVDTLQKKIKFGYKVGSGDAQLSAIQKFTSKQQYEAIVNMRDRNKEGTLNYENPYFASYLHLNDAAIATAGDEGRPPLVPFVFNGQWDGVSDYPDKELTTVPRFGYYKGMSTEGQYREENIPQPNYPKMFLVNYDDPTGLDPNLGFNDQVINGNLVPGLTTVFYGQHLTILRDGVVFDGYLHLKEGDVLELDYRPLRRLENNHLYILGAIKGFKPLLDNSTQTLLLRYRETRQEDIDAIDHSDLIGMNLVFPITP